MSEVAATLRCPCDERNCAQAFEYLEPPPGETRFALGGGCYRRHYDRCLICGHFFSRHGLELSALYESDYVDATYGGDQGLGERFRKILALPAGESDNAGRVVRVQAFARLRFGETIGERTLLDVGAGLGVFPAAMKAAGWRVTAIERDPRTVRHLREVVGVEAVVGELQNLVVECSVRYDVVTFNKVLEHTEDPIGLLDHSATVLSEEGFVYVELPDVAAAADGPGREEFFVEHHHVFSPESLAMLAARAGFSPVVIERLREPSGKYTLRGFLSR